MCRCLQKYRILQPILDIYTYNIQLYVFCKFSYNKILLFVNFFVTLHYHLSWDVPNDDNENKRHENEKKIDLDAGRHPSLRLNWICRIYNK